MTPYENGKVYGPYTRPDNRQHVVIAFPDGTKKTVSYPRYLMEMQLNRLLDEMEEVHHKNEDFTDNRIENLMVIHRTIHRMMHEVKYGPETWVCAHCGKSFEVTGHQVGRRISEQKRGRALTGPFCSRRCSGKVNN